MMLDVYKKQLPFYTGVFCNQNGMDFALICVTSLGTTQIKRFLKSYKKHLFWEKYLKQEKILLLISLLII